MALLSYRPAIALLLAVACAFWRQHGGRHQAAGKLSASQVELSGTCAGAPENAESCIEQHCQNDTAPPPQTHSADGTYIVRFRRYCLVAEHRHSLEAALSGSEWQWIERHNSAMHYPTDFALVHLGELEAAAVTAQLQALPFVKDVHAERKLTRTLKQLDMQGEQQHVEERSKDMGVSDTAALAAGPGRGGFEHCDDSADPLCIRKRPGRLQTRPTFSLEDNVDDGDDSVDGGNGAASGTKSSGGKLSTAGTSRRRRLAQSHNLAAILGADKIWAEGHRGGGIKMGVFDTGIKADHPDVKNIKERTNWTHEPTNDDRLGHGSFVAGVIAGTDASCPGLAPEVAIHTFRVFTNDQVSYTSWFLDAFNYAIATEMDVVNLSIGGPDYLDAPFVEKVLEVTSHGIIMTSAIGNDGPLWGTLNNPADQNDVIGVGGIDYGGAIAGFSSRGMSTWELPLGYGRAKPDVMAYGKDVSGSRIEGGCRSLSGTSVASPVVAGAVCLLASTIPASRRPQVLNPAAMKQALVEGAARLPGMSMFEQGQGGLNVLAAKDILAAYTPRASLVPAALNLTDCPYSWPFCRQPLYSGAMPLMFNATLLNGMGAVGQVEGEPIWTPSNEGGRLLDVRFGFSRHLWPWSGHLSLYIRVRPEGAAFNGTATGQVTVTVVSPPAKGESVPRRSTATLTLTAAIIPTPPRSRRVLWDQFHSLRYPPAYIPRDNLGVRHDILDWHGDHPHTNFHDMYNSLLDAGFYLEVLASPATCFNASAYVALMIVDSEDEFYPEEVAKLAADVLERGLALVVVADWYDVGTIEKLRFYDDNTRSWWEAAIGGANVPALNDLLRPLGAALAGGAIDADVAIPGVDSFRMASGSSIAAFPAGGFLHNVSLAGGAGQTAPVLGLAEIGAGRLVLYGDSTCLDSSHQQSNCYDLLKKALGWAGGQQDGSALLPRGGGLREAYGSMEGLPQRRPGFNFTEVSLVLQHPLRCYPNSPLEAQGLEYSPPAGSSSAKAQHAQQADAALTKPAVDAAASSRDISAEQQRARPVPQESNTAARGGGGGSGEGAGWLSGARRWLPTSAVQISQVFSVLGAMAIVTLWSVSQRRRAGSSAPPAPGLLHMLPLFWRRTGRGRAE